MVDAPKPTEPKPTEPKAASHTNKPKGPSLEDRVARLEKAVALGDPTSAAAMLKAK